MRFAVASFLIAALLLPACKHKRKWATPEPLGDDSMLSSRIVMADPSSADQLVTGFYAMEEDWRWTAKDFSVKLGTPPRAAQTGARFEVVLAVPDPIIQRLKSISLSAVINGLAMPSETYTKPGGYTYARDVPAGRLNSSVIPVDLHLDKALPPSNVDPRELGIIVQSIGFRAQ